MKGMLTPNPLHSLKNGKRVLITLSAVFFVLTFYSFAFAVNVMTPDTNTTIKLNLSNNFGTFVDYIKVTEPATDDVMGEFIGSEEAAPELIIPLKAFNNYTVEAGMIDPSANIKIPLKIKNIRVRAGGYPHTIYVPKNYMTMPIRLIYKSASGKKEYDGEACITLRHETLDIPAIEECGTGILNIPLIKGIYIAEITGNKMNPKYTKIYAFKETSVPKDVYISYKGTATVTVKFEQPLNKPVSLSIGNVSETMNAGEKEKTFTVESGRTPVIITMGVWTEGLKSYGGGVYNSEFMLFPEGKRLILLNEKYKYAYRGNRSKDYIESFLLGQEVSVGLTGATSYGREVCVIKRSGINVGEDIYKAGQSKTYRTFNGKFTREFNGRVTHVRDGDTVVIKPSGESTDVVCRFHGVDSTEIVQASYPITICAGERKYSITVTHSSKDLSDVRTAPDWTGNVDSYSCITTEKLRGGKYNIQGIDIETGETIREKANIFTGSATVNLTGVDVKMGTVLFRPKLYISKDRVEAINKGEFSVLITSDKGEQFVIPKGEEQLQIPVGKYTAQLYAEGYLPTIKQFYIKSGLWNYVDINVIPQSQFRKVKFIAQILQPKETSAKVIGAALEVDYFSGNERLRIPESATGVESLENKVVITADIPTGKTFYVNLTLHCEVGETKFDYVEKIKVRVLSEAQTPEIPEFYMLYDLSGEYVRVIARKNNAGVREYPDADFSYRVRTINNNIARGVKNLVINSTSGRIWLPDNAFIEVTGYSSKQTSDIMKYSAYYSSDEEKKEYSTFNSDLSANRAFLTKNRYKTPIQYDKTKYDSAAIYLEYGRTTEHNAHILIALKAKISASPSEKIEIVEDQWTLRGGKWKDKAVNLFAGLSDTEAERSFLAGVPDTGTYQLTGRIKIKSFDRDGDNNIVYITNNKGEMFPKYKIKNVNIAPISISIDSEKKIGSLVQEINIDLASASVELADRWTEKDTFKIPNFVPPVFTPVDHKVDRVSQKLDPETGEPDLCDRCPITPTMGYTYKVTLDKEEPLISNGLNVIKRTIKTESTSYLNQCENWCACSSNCVERTYSCTSAVNITEELYYLNEPGNDEATLQEYGVWAQTKAGRRTDLLPARTIVQAQSTGGAHCWKPSSYATTQNVRLSMSRAAYASQFFVADHDGVNPQYGDKYSSLKYIPESVRQPWATELPKNVFESNSRPITITLSTENGDVFPLYKAKSDISRKRKDGGYYKSYSNVLVEINGKRYTWRDSGIKSVFKKTFYTDVAPDDTAYITILGYAGLEEEKFDDGYFRWGSTSTEGNEASIIINPQTTFKAIGIGDTIKLVVKAKTDKPEGFKGKKVYVSAYPNIGKTIRSVTQGTIGDAYGWYGGDVTELIVNSENIQETKEHVLTIKRREPHNKEEKIPLVFYTSDTEGFVSKTWFGQIMQSTLGSDIAMEAMDVLAIENAQEASGTFLWTVKEVSAAIEGDAGFMNATIPFVGQSKIPTKTVNLKIRATSDKGFHANLIDIAMLTGVTQVFKHGARGVVRLKNTLGEAATLLSRIDNFKATGGTTFFFEGPEFLATKLDDKGMQIIFKKTDEWYSEEGFRAKYAAVTQLDKNISRVSKAHEYLRYLTQQPFSNLMIKAATTVTGAAAKTVSIAGQVFAPFGGLPPSGMPYIQARSTEDSRFIVPNCEGCSETMQIRQWITNHFNKPLASKEVTLPLKVKEGKSIFINAVAAGHAPVKQIIRVGESDTIDVDIPLRRDNTFGLNPFADVEGFFNMHPMFSEVVETVFLAPEVYAWSDQRKPITDYMSQGLADFARAMGSNFKIDF